MAVNSPAATAKSTCASMHFYITDLIGFTQLPDFNYDWHIILSILYVFYRLIFVIKKEADRQDRPYRVADY